MKRKLFVALIALAFIAGTAGMAKAAQDIENTSQLGSLLIYPLISVDFDGDNTDTFITLSNLSKSGVNVKCYWIYCGEECRKRDFGFFLTAGQPIWFSAKTGQGGNVNVPALPQSSFAELKCWAVNSNGEQIRWNYLMGEATLIDFNYNVAATYPAHSFLALGVANKQVVGTPGELLLAGKKSVAGADDGRYDSCYKYLYFDFFATGSVISSAPGFNPPNPLYPPIQTQANVLAITPCKEDLKQGGKPTITKLEFDITDENETKYTNIYDCLECFWVDELGDLDPLFTSAFPGGLQTDLGRVRVWGNGNPLCDNFFFDDDGIKHITNYSVFTGLVGVHVSKFGFLHNLALGGLKATTGFGSEQFIPASGDPNRNFPDRILYDVF